MVENKSGLRPLGAAVLVKDYQPEIKKGVIVIPDTAKENMLATEQRAIVLAVGPEAWRDESEPRAKPGDKVLVSRYAGYIAKGPLDGELYRVVNARDIFLKIEEEQSNE